MEGIKRAREIAALLGGSVLPAAPSPRLRRRILASAGGADRRFGWAPFLAGALGLSLFAAVYFAGRERDLGNELSRVRDINRQQTIELTRVNEAFAIVNGVDTTVTTFGEGQPQTKGKVFVNPSQGVLLIASNLRPAPAGKAYEMWIIPKGGKPKPAGMFQSSSEGGAMHVQRGPSGDTAVVAVTLENEAGADAPTSAILFAAQIPGPQH
jgi:hypothetical protein